MPKNDPMSKKSLFETLNDTATIIAKGVCNIWFILAVVFWAAVWLGWIKLKY
jgi:hypothetical protein